MATLLQDVRYGLRMLRKAPGFTTVAVLTLALGIGANTAVFSIVDALALRPLPVPDARHLVTIYTSGKTSRGAYLTGPTSYPDLADYRAGAPAFSAIAGFENRGSLLRVGDETVMLLTCVVTENYFSLLGVNAVHGRTFSEQEFQTPDFPREVVISYSLWQKYFAGDPKVVGSNIRLTGGDYVIAGILPKEFRGTELTAAPDIFMPAVVWGREEMAARSNARFQLLARLKPGVDLRQARAQMDTVAQRLAAAYPKERSGRVITLQWEPETRGGMRNLGYIFLAVAALVLMIACANVAGLLLARSETRRREIATRMAIGANRLRLTRQMLTESLLLSLLGLGVAVLVALWVVNALPGILPTQVAMMGIDFRLDQRAVAFAFATAFFSLIVFGVAPAVQSCRVSLVSELKEGGAAATAPGRAWARNVLIIGQVALSVVLLTGAGLLVRTFIKASRQDFGFDASSQMLLLQILPGSRESAAQFSTSHPQLLERIEAIPGVERASLGNRAPFADYNGGWKMTVYVPGMQLGPSEQGVPINVGRADGNYFPALGMALLRGRTFGSRDQPKSQRVAILNETAARRLFPGADPLGQHFRFGGPNGQDCEVVGIVRDAKYNFVTEEIMPYMYVPVTQQGGDTVLLVKTRVAAASVLPLVRREIKAFDSTMSIFSVVTMTEHIRAALYVQRASAGLVLTLGLLGLTLAVVGLYGVLSYYVNRRRHEIGVRIAVGAQPGAVFRMVVRRGLLLATIGTVLGIAGALAGTRFLADLLFGVSPHDPLTLVVVTGLLLLVAVLAAAVPARRATKVDPMVALRYE